MGEETDIAEPMSSEDVVAAEAVAGSEPSRDQHRKRKKNLYKCLRDLMEFYLGDVNLSKDRFMSQQIKGQPFVYVDLSKFLTFNKVRALTSSVEDLAQAVSQSEILQVSEDGTQVCRKTPIKKKENEDDCTIYVEQLGPDMDHDLLTKVFSEFGPVDYVSMPRFSHNNKFKGFAFVEFRDPESAKKALEVLNAEGCCLSPHMAPEELMSIKNFDPNKENKKEDTAKANETDHDQNHTDSNKNKESEKVSEKEHSTDNESISKDMKIATIKENEVGGEKDKAKKEKLKRKFVEEEEQVSCKKAKLEKNTENHKDQENSVNTSENNKKSVKLNKKSSEEFKDKDLPESTKESQNKKTKGKTKEKTNTDIKGTVDKPTEQEESKDELASQGKKKKRKYSGDELKTDSNLENKLDEGASEPPKKKHKEGNDDATETDASQPGGSVEDRALKQKKKRKKKKKAKKDKSSAISLGLKVLPKKEWKQLRNKYLNMQREMMRSLKQHLSYSKWEKKPEKAVVEAEDKLTKPGTVIKVTLEEPVNSVKAAKSDLRVHPEIRYVDATEGSCCAYLRTSTPEVAATLVQAKHWPAMEILQGEEEAAYWNKMKNDREEHLKNRIKPNQRGRTKLLKRAERFQGKHMTTFEAL